MSIRLNRPEPIDVAGMPPPSLVEIEYRNERRGALERLDKGKADYLAWLAEAAIGEKMSDEWLLAHAEVLEWLDLARMDKAEVSPMARRLKVGSVFVLDDPADLEPLWGSGDEVLWAAGEPTHIVGPTGVGKTTVALQVLAGRLGLYSEVLGLPVAPSEGKVLYLAMDRPRQIRRAMRRLFNEEQRELLEKRLVVWEGPLPGDLGKNPGVLLSVAEEAGASDIFIDSLKDAAVKITDDEVGGNLNRAMQFAIRDGYQVFGLHHQRKGQGGSKPNTLEDVYGSTWITAGAGSVILLWGSAGDPLVEVMHLKQPAGEVGPMKIEHDHHKGRSSVFRGLVDALVVLRSRPGGMTAMDLARMMYEKDAPSENDRKKAQRQLERLVRDGLASVEAGVKGGDGKAVASLYRNIGEMEGLVS